MRISNFKKYQDLVQGKTYWEFRIGENRCCLNRWDWIIEFYVGSIEGIQGTFEFKQHNKVEWKFTFRIPVWLDRYDKCIRLMWPF